MDMEGGPQGTMSMKMRSQAKRVGECTPEDKAEAERQSERTADLPRHGGDHGCFRSSSTAAAAHSPPTRSSPKKSRQALKAAGLDVEVELLSGGDCAVRARAIAERGDPC